MDINQRVVRIIDKVANSKSAFSQATGISPVILSHISSGRNKVSLSAVQQILSAYPQLNSDYLIQGHGQMFKENNDHSNLSLIHDQLLKLKETSENQHKSVQVRIESLLNEIDTMLG